MRPARRTLQSFLALACLAFTPAAQAAGGVSLRWNACYGYADGEVQNMNFACDTNTGARVLVGSFKLGTNLSQASGNEMVLDLASAGTAATPLPQWWAFKNAGTCRQTSLAFGLAAPGACTDWAVPEATGGIGAYNIGHRGPNTARVVMALAVPAANFQDLVAGLEYFSFTLTIDNQKTVGVGSCGGCTTPVCLVLKSITVTTPILANNRLLTGPSNGVDSDFATWQGGGVPVVGGQAGCPAATPTLQRTWGAVKALYH